MGIRTRIRSGSEALIERALGVTIVRNAAYGRDPYPAVRRLRKWSPGDVIFDVGANDGRTVVRLREHFPNPRIFAFEPVTTTFNALVERMRGLSNVDCMQLALGAEPGTTTIYLHDVSEMNSLRSDWAEATDSEQVQVTTVDRLMEEHDIPFLHFLKIDAEGTESDVLDGARQALTDQRVAVIQVEAGFDRQVSPHTPLELVREKLAAYGYHLNGVFNQCGSRRAVRPPASWSPANAEGYKPSLLKYCDAVFVAADLSQRRLQA